MYDVTLGELLDEQQAQMLVKKFAAGFTLVGELDGRVCVFVSLPYACYCLAGL